MDVLELVEKLVEAGVSLEEVKQAKGEIQKLDNEISKLKEKIAKLEEKKAEIVQGFPEEIRALIIGKRTVKRGSSGGKGGGGRVRVRINGQEFDSLKEAYYHLFPERRGKAYKFREELEKLAQKGEITLEYL